MKIIINLTVLLLSMTAMALCVLAQTTPAETNPAMAYYRAFLLAPDLSESDQEYLASNNLWSVTLPGKFGELVARYDPEFKLVRQAGQLSGRCDWGIDMSQGPATLLPHLARCKGVMIGARYRVAWHLQNGQQEEARDDLLAAFVLARNISRDGTLISVLVQIAAEAIGCDIIAQNYGKFTPKRCKTWSAALMPHLRQEPSPRASRSRKSQSTIGSSTKSRNSNALLRETKQQSWLASGTWW